MKKTVSVIGSLLVLATLSTNCQKENINCEGDNAHHIETFYGNEFAIIPCSLQNINSDTKEVNLVIKTQADFEKYLSCSNEAPAINFEEYFILVGRYTHYQCAMFDNQEVIICDNRVVYRVRMYEKDCLSFTDVFYITVIEKQYENIPVVFDVKFN